MLTSFARAQRCAMFVFVLTLALAGSRFATQALAAGAFAIGKCAAYGKAYDYAGEKAARPPAPKQRKGDCPTPTIKPACPAPAFHIPKPPPTHPHTHQP